MEEEDGELSLSPFVIGTCVFGIITLLIGFTMAFEAMEEHLIHSSSKHMRPMISSLFGEMTILGFLSLITYSISEAGILKKISISIINESEEGKMYLTELFEKVHYLLFTIMVLFIGQVLLLLHMATKTVDFWREENKQVQNPSDIQKWTEKYLHPEPKRWWDFSMSADLATRFFAFYSLRKEFITHRKSIPPFTRAAPSEHLPEHFDFAEYLSICLGDFLAQIIHLPPVTWGALWLLTVVFYMVFLSLEGEVILVSLSWTILGVLNLLCVMILDKKSHKILSMLLNPSDFPRRHSFQSVGRVVRSSIRFLPHALKQSKPYTDVNSSSIAASKNETTGLLPSHEELPAWTALTPQLPSVLWTWIGGATLPNRHLALFWGGHIGPEVHVFLLRLHLILLSVYVALVIAVFVPLLAAELGPLHGFAYLLVSLFMVAWEFEFVLKDLITTLCKVSCCGMLRRTAAIDDVIRKQKTKRAVRALMMMSSIVETAKSKENCSATDLASRPVVSAVMPTVTQDEINEIGNIFDMYDADASGFIELTEMKNVISSLGATLTDEQARAIYAFIDLNGDGFISREEFITVYITKFQYKNMDRHTKAKKMFELFDRDGSGAIRVSELIEGLQGLKHGLTCDDIVALAKELDENGDGEISLHEFEAIIEA